MCIRLGAVSVPFPQIRSTAMKALWTVLVVAAVFCASAMATQNSIVSDAIYGADRNVDPTPCNGTNDTPNNCSPVKGQQCTARWDMYFAIAPATSRIYESREYCADFSGCQSQITWVDVTNDLDPCFPLPIVFSVDPINP